MLNRNMVHGLAGVIVAGALLLQTAAFGACTTNAECKGGRECQGGECVDPVASCGADVDCPGDQICTQGVCADPASPKPADTAVVERAPEPAVQEVAPAEALPTTAPMAGPEHKVVRKPITGLVIAGAIVFGVAYTGAFTTTVALEADGDLIGYSLVPLAGPWIMLGDYRTREYQAALAMNGVIQAGGAAMFIIGLTVKREHVVPVYSSRDGNVSVGMSPVVFGPGSGVGLSGRF
jgi:hypothetical protein